MLISEFACAAGLKTDTVRYYVKRGLLRPEQSGKGGQNPYHIFSERDVQEALMIRVLKVLGLSLASIETLLDDKRKGLVSKDDEIAFIEERRRILLGRAEQMQKLGYYLQLKVDWLKGIIEEPPSLSQFFETAGRGALELLEDDAAA
jgi:MerR family copper efflux transcriptional regulator